MPFVAVGSGQAIADTFLAFLWRVFWPNTCPNLTEGIFAAHWTLDHAIKTNPGGVDAPVHVAVLEEVDGACKARLLDRAELDEHGQHSAQAEEYLREFRGQLDPAMAETPEIPPVDGDEPEAGADEGQPPPS